MKIWTDLAKTSNVTIWKESSQSELREIYESETVQYLFNFIVEVQRNKETNT